MSQEGSGLPLVSRFAEGTEKRMNSVFISLEVLIPILRL